MVNGRPVAKQRENVLKFVAHRCDGPCIAPKAKSIIEEKFRNWSELDSWEYTKEDGTKEKKMPGEGDSFVIEPTWNMLLDIEETPIFNRIDIKGRITFKNDMNIHLRAKKIVIAGGELIIGKEDDFNKDGTVKKKNRYELDGKITLFGGKEEPAVAIEDQGTEAGSKIIANVGLL